MTNHDQDLSATVYALHGQLALLQAEDGSRFQASIPGRLKKGKRRSKTPLVVGDVVDIEPEGEGSAKILKVHDRHSSLSRPSSSNAHQEQVIAANVDQVLVVVAADLLLEYVEPDQLELLDAILVSAASCDLQVSIVVNKLDLSSEETVGQIMSPYVEMGYLVTLVSALQGTGIEELKALLRDRVSVFSGPSGVGKSSLVNAIQPGLTIRTQEVSPQSGEGRHTTTHVQLHPLDEGGFIVDTPGVREFGLWRVDALGLPHWYLDFNEVQHQCRFNTCSHTHEPGCAIKAGIESGVIDTGRYERYLRIRQRLIDQEREKGYTS